MQDELNAKVAREYSTIERHLNDVQEAIEHVFNCLQSTFIKIGPVLSATNPEPMSEPSPDEDATNQMSGRLIGFRIELERIVASVRDMNARIEL